MACKVTLQQDCVLATVSLYVSADIVSHMQHMQMTYSGQHVHFKASHPRSLMPIHSSALKLIVQGLSPSYCCSTFQNPMCTYSESSVKPHMVSEQREREGGDTLVDAQVDAASLVTTVSHITYSPPTPTGAALRLFRTAFRF